MTHGGGGAPRGPRRAPHSSNGLHMKEETPLGKLLLALSNVMGAIALAFLLFMMLGTTIDAVFRTIAGSPLPGLFEMSELSMVMIVFMGLGWTQFDDAHIRVTMARKWLPEAAGRALDCLAWLLAAAMLAVLAYPATGEAIESVAIREFRWGYVEVPIWWTKVAVAIGLWFGALQMLFCAARALCGRAPRRTADVAAAASH